MTNTERKTASTASKPSEFPFIFAVFYLAFFFMLRDWQAVLCFFVLSQILIWDQKHSSVHQYDFATLLVGLLVATHSIVDRTITNEYYVLSMSILLLVFAVISGDSAVSTFSLAYKKLSDSVLTFTSLAVRYLVSLNRNLALVISQHLHTRLSTFRSVTGSSSGFFRTDTFSSTHQLVQSVFDASRYVKLLLI